MKLLYSLSNMRIILAACLILVSITSQAQTLTARPNVRITSNCNGFYEYTPAGYNPSGSQTYPVLIAFGGISQNGDGSAGQLDYVFSNWGGPGWQIINGRFPSSITVNGELFRFIVILPQFSSSASPKGVDDLISYVLSHYKGDPSRIYLTGNSLGGGYCWDYPGSSVAYGQRIAAIVPTCAAASYNTTKANNIAAANVPVWATHNAVDNVVSPGTTMAFVNGINGVPSPPNPRAKMSIFQDEGHNCADATFNMTTGIGAYAWMLGYKRGSTPPVNQVPVARAGNDVTITLPTNSVQLNGNGSYDNDGTITYSWSKIAGPTQFNISNTGIVNPVFSNLVAGTYTLRLTVTDNKGAAATDDINIVVNAAPVNQPPVARAGNDITITLPINSVQLNGSGSTDADGTITYKWTKTAGPTQYTFSNSNIVNPVLSNLVAGTYTLRLTVTDNKGATSVDDINVIVNPVGVNIPPVSNAGPDITITLPTSTALVSGSGTDADGTITAYAWTQVSGPNASGIGSPAGPQSTMSKLVQGIYIYQLKVTDNKGATATNTMQLTVNPAGQQTGTKYIMVNVYGGSNPYNNTSWNNWNVGTGTTSNITSGLFKYSDGTSSSVNSVLSYSQAMGDNAVDYPGGMAPAEVLRYTSYSQQTRTLTVSGLLTTLKYNIELYASRWSEGNSTLFTVNGTSVNIATFRNFSNKATFNNISPNAQGKIVVSIQSLNNYNYLNGFMITQQSSTGARPEYVTQAGASSSGLATTTVAEDETTSLNAKKLINGITSMEAFPNPATDKVVLKVSNVPPGIMKVQVINSNGVIRKQLLLKHALPVSNVNIPMSELPPGTYIIKVQIGSWSALKKIIK